MRPLQFMMASPTSRGSSQVEIQACNSAIGELWFNPCAFSSNPKAALFGRAAWVSIARMKRSRLLLPALVLAGCATAPTVGADRQVEVYTDPQPGASPPAYATRTDYPPGQDVPILLDGRAVSAVPAADLLP